MNFRLTIQYDGTEFHGWQIQDGQRTVQGELTRAVSLIEGRKVVLHGSGRTDAGVHAEAQVASVKLERDIAPDKLLAAINGNVARDVRVIDAEIVPDDFHARFSAQGKTYRYSVFNARYLSPFCLRYAYHEARHLSVEAMREAARVFVGKHDWTAFSSAQADVESRVRTLTELSITEHDDDDRARGRIIEMTMSADGFLRYMVRSIAGTLLAVGRGEMNAQDIARLIESRDRAQAAATAPPHGLTLVKVHY